MRRGRPRKMSVPETAVPVMLGLGEPPSVSVTLRLTNAIADGIWEKLGLEDKARLIVAL